MEFSPFGNDLFGDPISPQGQGMVKERFTFPPFTVLDGRSGEWQDRKRAWLSLGIASDLGREGLGDTSATSMDYFNKGKTIAGDAGSVFDPVMAELCYQWFCPSGGHILDPFAGGSVRGIVANLVGNRYTGIDIRQEQVTANYENAREMGIQPNDKLYWVVGDSLEILKSPACPTIASGFYDFIFSCPPYGDLETYSNNPADISNMGYVDFMAAYEEIINLSVRALADHSFAAFVVGNFRNKDGFYNDFVSDTIRAFENAGAGLYNEAILVTPVGTACLRVTKQFNAGRKMAKTHQNLLVFCKGDWKMAANKIKE